MFIQFGKACSIGKDVQYFFAVKILDSTLLKWIFRVRGFGD